MWSLLRRLIYIYIYKFWWQKYQKSKFYKNKKAFKIDDIDANEISVSKEEPYGANKSIKYFIGYNDNDNNVF